MKFGREVMATGNINPSRWVSDCGTYNIARYTYSHQKGWCDPYYVGYRKHDGKRITEDHSSLEIAAKKVEVFHTRTDAFLGY